MTHAKHPAKSITPSSACCTVPVIQKRQVKKQSCLLLWRTGNLQNSLRKTVLIGSTQFQLFSIFWILAAMMPISTMEQKKEHKAVETSHLLLESDRWIMSFFVWISIGNYLLNSCEFIFVGRPPENHACHHKAQSAPNTNCHLFQFSRRQAAVTGQRSYLYRRYEPRFH